MNSGLKLSIDIQGGAQPRSRQKPDVVLIHGTGSHAGMWSSQVGNLVNRGHRCLTPDLRGHGKTGELYEATDIEAHIGDILESLEVVDIQYPAIFIGHSLGAIISLKLAMENPHMTRRIFLAALPGRVYKPVSKLFKVFLSGPFQTMKNLPIEKALSWRHRALLDTDLHSLNQIVDNFAELDLVSPSIEVKCPVHLSAGRFDPVAPFQYVREIHRSIPHSTLKVYDLGGHNFMDYNQASLNNWIFEHIDSDLET